MSYWLGSGIVPLNDSRNYTRPKKKLPPRAGLPPLVAKSAEELQMAMAMPVEECRAGLLRTLEYYGASRINESQLTVPFGLSEGAESEIVNPARVDIALLEEAARLCIQQACARDDV